MLKFEIQKRTAVNYRNTIQMKKYSFDVGKIKTVGHPCWTGRHGQQSTSTYAFNVMQPRESWADLRFFFFNNMVW